IGSGLTVSGGKLVLAGTGPDIAHPNSTDQIYDNVTVALNGGVFDLNGRSETIATLTSSSSTASGILTNTAAETTSTLTVGANNTNGTFYGVISDGTGVVALAKIGGGTQTLTGANTYTGGTTITGGIVSIGTGGTGSDTASVEALGTGAVTINSGGTLRLWIQNSREFTIANDITVNGGTIHNEDGLHHLTGAIGVGENGATFAIKWNGKYLFIDGPISGNGKVTIAHASGGNTGGAVFFNGTNSYIGETAIGAGATLVITSLANLGTGEVSLSTGSRLVYNGTGAATLTDSIRIYDAGDRYLEIGDDATLTLERLYAGGSDRHVVKGGEGTLILAGAEDNSFAALRVTAGTVVLAKEGTEHNGAKALGSGTLTISGGKLVLAGTGADSAHPYNTDQIYHNVRVVLTGGIFDTNGRSEEISSLSSTSSTASGIVTNSAADTVSKLSVGTNNASGTFYGVIGDGAGTVALAKVGTGTETLTGANTYTGGTTIKLGILQLDFSASGAPAANILAENSALTLGGSSLHIRGGNGTDGLVQSFSKVELTQDATIRLFPDNATRLDVQLGEITTNGHTLALSGTDTTLVEGKAIAGVANFLTTTAAGNNDGTRRLSGVLFNGTAWASTAADAGNTGNYIVPWTASYTNVYARNDTLLDYVTADVRLVNGTGESPTLALKSTEAAIVVNSLLMSATDAAATIATEGKSFSLVSGDLALGAGAQALTIGAVPNDGTLTSGTQLLWVVNASASPLTFNAAITDNTGAVNVLLDGGTSVFAGANTYSGTTTIANGAQLHVNATGAVGTGDIVNNGIFVIRNDDSRTLANKISGGGSFEKYGEGTLAITSDNTFAGAALIGEGAVEISSFAKLGNGLIFFYGGTIRYTGEGEESVSRPITVSPEYGTAPSGSVLDIVNPDAVLTLRKVDDFKNNKITKTGPGTLVLGGTAASYGASIVVEEGTLYLAHETTNYIGAVGSSKPGDYGLVINAGNVIVQGPIVLPRPQESSSTTSQIYFESGVQVNGGVLDLNGRHECIAYLDGTGGVITNTAETLSFFRVGSTASDRSIRNEPSNYAGVITGDIALTKSGNGTFTLSGENTYTGGTTVLTGILRLDFSAENAPQANILAAGSALTLDGSGALEIVAGAETNGLVQSFLKTTLIGNSVIRVNRGDAERVDVQLGSIATDGHTLKVFGGDTTLVDSHAVIGAVNFRTTSSAGDNDGATRLAGVIFGAEGWASIAFDSGNETKYLVPLGDAAYTDVGGGNTIPAVPAADIRLNDGTGNIALGADTTTVNSLIATATTAPTVIETAGKTLVLASGDIALAVGAQELSVGATPADAGSITAGDGTDAASLSVTNVSSASLVLNAAITDNADAVVGVTANGTGKIVLAGVNTYKGETTVESGILLINGDQRAATGAVTVKDGATLGGKGGIIGGVVTVEDGGTLSPGASIGELSFTENVTLSAGAKLILEIDTSGGVPQFDLITFLGADKTLTLAEEGALEISNIGGASIEGSFQIVQNATVLGTLAFSDSRYAYTFGEGGLLTITSVPEPSTYALIGAVGAVALAFIRRRRRPSKTGL
ncbi:MAG: autotransporter-associated beta strand repeat-containing protein, partial [Puniceicoccales bacterium]|nr:autotransporter-associated beta strand repeat-containing protein [Puniceicoccales bacterium]